VGGGGEQGAGVSDGCCGGLRVVGLGLGLVGGLGLAFAWFYNLPESSFIDQHQTNINKCPSQGLLGAAAPTVC